jgi:hypothetical protein
MHRYGIAPASLLHLSASPLPHSCRGSQQRLIASFPPGKFDEVRLLYLDQIAGLENLHNQVKEGLDHLREETEHLQHIDEVIRRQRGALDATFQELESKRVLFQEKGSCFFFF